jgi:hypothetical protein
MYSSDWAHVRLSVGVAGVIGGLGGWIYGVSRASGARGALVVAFQSALFSGSFFVVREGFRHAVKVDSWQQDWIAINTLSCGTGAAVMGLLREASLSKRVFVRSFLGGAVLGMLGSAAYLVVDRLVLNRSQASGGMEWPSAPAWFPFRKISDEEVQKRREKY